MENQQLILIQQELYKSSYESLKKNKNKTVQKFTTKNSDRELEQEYMSILIDEESSDTDIQSISSKLLPPKTTQPNNISFLNYQEKAGTVCDRYYICEIMIAAIILCGLALPYVIIAASPVSNRSA
jgi:hypothetical protein